MTNEEIQTLIDESGAALARIEAGLKRAQATLNEINAAFDIVEQQAFNQRVRQTMAEIANLAGLREQK